MNSSLYLDTPFNIVDVTVMRLLEGDSGSMTSSYRDIYTNIRLGQAGSDGDLPSSFIVGGKVSTGSDTDQRNDSFFDNVELQYRLNQNASQYLRVFYENNTYDWLEGVIGQYGAGFLWKRKLQHFRDIFRFKNSTPNVPIAPADSTKKERRTTE